MTPTAGPEREHEWLTDGGAAGARIRTIAWSGTPLGSRAGWSTALRCALQLVLDSRTPMALVIGAARVFVCNDAYRAAHPDAPALGTVAPAGFPEAATACSPVRDEHGQEIAVLVTPTVAPAAGEGAADDAALLAALVDSSPDVIFAKDRHGRLRFANPATLALVGKQADQVIGKTDAEILADAEAAAQVMRNDRLIMERGTASEIEEHVPLPDGTARVWLSRKVPYRDRHGRVVGLLGISTDITERKRAEAALRQSEERFRSVVENMSEGLMIFDPDGNLVYQNPASLRLHGFDPAGEGRLARGEVPITWDAWDEHGRPIGFDEWPVSRVFRRERFGGQVLRVRRVETGREFHASYNGSPVHDPDGALAVGFITIRDLSDEVQAQAALRESEEIARASLDAAQLGTWRHDLATDEIAFDARGAEHYGFPDGRARLDQVLARVHPDDLTRLRAAVASTLGADRTGRYAIEYRVVRDDGAVRWLAVQARLRFEGEGAHRRPVAGFGTSQDVTERKQAEQALSEANARLREADQRKNEFLATLSHELRNPLAAIRTSVFVLGQPGLAGEQGARALAVIDRQARQLASLVDDLLDVTRIGNAKVTLHRQVIELGALAAEAIDDHRDAFAASGVELALALPAGPVWVDGDPTRLAQVLGNLLSNAVKFTPRGGHAVLSVDADGPWAIVRVRDDGAGVAAGTLPHIFEPFVQGAQTLDRTRGGLGLGLALVKSLVDLHGGTVAAASQGEGQGAELTVRLPRVAPAPAEVPVGEVPRRPVPARGPRVLIIEDNVDAAETLRDALELAGHDVIGVAHTGPDGIAAARQLGPDVVRGDLGLPEVDGFGVARALRGDDDARLRSTFLVALSGYALSDDVARARSAGFDRHLPKPASIERLTALLAEVP